MHAARSRYIAAACILRWIKLSQFRYTARSSNPLRLSLRLLHLEHSHMSSQMVLVQVAGSEA